MQEEEDLYRLRVELPKHSIPQLPDDYIPSRLGPNRQYFVYKSPWLYDLGTTKRRRSSYDRFVPDCAIVRYVQSFLLNKPHRTDLYVLH